VQKIQKIFKPEAVGRDQWFVVMRRKGLVVEVEKFEDMESTTNKFTISRPCKFLHATDDLTGFGLVSWLLRY
jgi:hypothetical protein